MHSFPPPPPHRFESLAGPANSNWVVKGHVLVGPHPGPVSTGEMVRNLQALLGAGVTTFVCLQHEMPSSVTSATSASPGTPSIRQRSTFGSHNVVTAKPYIDQAQVVAETSGLPQVAGGERISFIHFPIGETHGAAAADEDVIRLVLDLYGHILAGEVLYIQCSDGNGRTGTIASLLLGIIYHMSSSEALDACQRARDHRPGPSGLSPETHEQKMQVHRLLSRSDLMRRAGSVRPRRSGDEERTIRTDVHHIARKIRQYLSRRGTASLWYLRRYLEEVGSATGGTLSPGDLGHALAEFLGVSFTQEEMEALARYHSGALVPADVCETIRGELSSARHHMVLSAFAQLDKDGSGQVKMDDIAVHFNAAAHPEVTSGHKTEEDALREFLETFGVDRRGRNVAFDEFLDYYRDISAAVEDDAYFRLMLWKIWGIVHEELPAQRAVAGKPSAISGGAVPVARAGEPGFGQYPARPRKDLESAMDSLLSTLQQRSDFGVAILGQRLAQVDGDRDGRLTEPEFLSVLGEMGAAPEDGPVIFRAYAAERTAHDEPALPLAAFSADLRGSLSPFRRRLVLAAFERLDQAAGQPGAVPLSVVAGSFLPEKHPAVEAGRKRPEGVLREFLAALGPGEASGGREPVVHLPYFERLGEALSAGIPDDNAFQLVMWHCWALGAGSRRRPGHAQPDTPRRLTRTVDDVATHADEREPGFLATMERLAGGPGGRNALRGRAALLSRGAAGGPSSASGIPGTPPVGQAALNFAPPAEAGVGSQRAHFVSHPAKTTSAAIIGSGASGVWSSPQREERSGGWSRFPASPRGDVSSAALAHVAPAHWSPSAPATPTGPRGAASSGLDAQLPHDGSSSPPQEYGWSDRGRRHFRDTQTAAQLASPGAASAVRDIHAPEAEVAAIRAQFRRAAEAGGRAAEPPGPPSARFGFPEEKSGEEVGEAVDRLRETLRARGVARGFFGFFRALGIGLGTNPALNPRLPTEQLLTFHDFWNRIRNFGLPYAEDDARTLMRGFLDPETQALDCGKLVRALCDVGSPVRKLLVRRAFRKLLDETAQREEPTAPIADVPVELIRLTYDSAAHPDVRNRRREETDVLREFLETFFPDAPDSARVSLEDFSAYHAVVSANHPDDDYFRLFLWSVWHLHDESRHGLDDDSEGALTNSPFTNRFQTRAAGLVGDPTVGGAGVDPALVGELRSPGRLSHLHGSGALVGGADRPEQASHAGAEGHSEGTSRGWGIERLGWTTGQTGLGGGAAGTGGRSEAGAEAVLARLRNTLRRRGAETFLQLATSLRRAAWSGASARTTRPGGEEPFLTVSQFRAALSEVGVGLSDAEVAAVFAAYDPGHMSGYMDGEGFLRGVAGDMTPFREDLVRRAYSRMARRAATVPSDVIAASFRVEHSGEVRSGRKSSDQVLREFMAPLLMRHGLETRSVEVSEEDWVDQFRLISAGVEDDGYFQLMMWNMWGLGGV